MRRYLLTALLAVLIGNGLVAADTISIPFSFSPNTTIQSSQVNSNFSTIYNAFNGGISDANIASITETKITFTGTGHDHSGGAKGMFVAMPVVNGRLQYNSATSIKLCPFQGNRIYVKVSGVWTATTISSSCISANNTSIFIDGTGGSNLAASTTYYVYIFDNAGTRTIDYSTTGHATDATTGMETKTAVDTRVLVGMVRTNGSSQFTAFLVLSYHNRATRNQQTTFTADRSTASGTYVELNTEIQNTFLTWGDEGVLVSVVGTVTNASNAGMNTAVGLDGTSAQAGFESAQSTAGSVSNNPAIAIAGTLGGASEGYHYVTLLGRVSAGTGSWTSTSGTGSNGTAKTYLHVTVRG